MGNPSNRTSSAGSDKRSVGIQVPQFSIVIPHYTDAERTIKLVREVVRASDWLSQRHFSDNETLSAWHCDRLVELVVVDDASPDGSGDMLEHAFEDSAEVFEDACLQGIFKRNKQNLGFASTVNRGASIATGKTLIICNSDIVISEKQPLSKIFIGLDNVLTDGSVGAVMPLIFNVPLAEVENANDLWANRGLLWLRRLKETNELTAIAKTLIEGKDSGSKTGTVSADSITQNSLIDSVLCGAFFAMRRIDFLELGGLNPVFHPYYWEDVELGVRVKLSGKRVVADRNLAVLHQHDGSIGKSTTEKKRWNAMFENQLRFTRMHGEELGVTGGRFWSFLRGLRSTLKGDFYMAKRYLKG